MKKLYLPWVLLRLLAENPVWNIPNKNTKTQILPTHNPNNKSVTLIFTSCEYFPQRKRKSLPHNLNPFLTTQQQKARSLSVPRDEPFFLLSSTTNVFAKKTSAIKIDDGDKKKIRNPNSKMKMNPTSTLAWRRLSLWLAGKRLLQATEKPHLDSVETGGAIYVRTASSPWLLIWFMGEMLFG